MPNPIRNTAEEAAQNPLLTLGAMMGGGGAIEAQEARGQRELVESEQLPVRMMGVTDADLITLGFTLGEPTPGDKLFRPATLPPGWKKQATDHSMWSKIVDESGRERFSIFYKASFYDRDAFMRSVDG